MSLISSTVDRVLVITVVALTAACVAFGALYMYRGTVIENQNKTISLQQTTIDNYAKDKTAQDVADKERESKTAVIAKERDEYKKRLKDAQKGNKCIDTAIPDDAQRVLEELYGSQGS